MIRAVVRNGTIHPIEPMPSEWVDGREVVVEDAESPKLVEDIDRWYRELQADATAIEPADDLTLQEALSEVRRQAKQLARHEMGLE